MYFLPERGTMAPNSVDTVKGESPMTDLQFTAYIELRDKYETLLQEALAMKLAPSQKGEDSVSDYQFQQYEQIRDRNDELKTELASLRKENAKLKLQVDILRTSSRRVRY